MPNHHSGHHDVNPQGHHHDVNRLLQAAELGDESGIQVLIDSGYDINDCDENGTTALHVAAANDHVSFRYKAGCHIMIHNYV